MPIDQVKSRLVRIGSILPEIHIIQNYVFLILPILNHLRLNCQVKMLNLLGYIYTISILPGDMGFIQSYRLLEFIIIISTVW